MMIPYNRFFAQIDWQGVIMTKISELKKILGHYFPWHKSRLECFLGILLGLFTVSTVNLREIALAMPGVTNIDSRYRRIKAFFTDFKMDYQKIAVWIFNQFVVNPKQTVYLSMDRTNWYYGKAKINALVLAIAHEGVGIPIYWEMLDKAGNSTAKEQIALIKLFVDTFGKECIEGLLADREFASKKLFSWLIKQKIPFFIRIKENTLVRIFKVSKPTNLKTMFKKVNNKQQNYFSYSVYLFDLKLNVAAGRSEKGELLIVVTNGDCKNAVPVYLRRWEIECLFEALKSRGFNFEKTHLTQLDKVKKLIGLLAIGTAWTIKVAEWRNKIVPIRFNRHRESVRPQNSFFRYGLDFIRDVLFKPIHSLREFKRCLNPIRIKNPLFKPLSEHKGLAC